MVSMMMMMMDCIQFFGREKDFGGGFDWRWDYGRRTCFSLTFSPSFFLSFSYVLIKKEEEEKKEMDRQRNTLIFCTHTHTLTARQAARLAMRWMMALSQITAPP